MLCVISAHMPSKKVSADLEIIAHVLPIDHDRRAPDAQIN